MNLMKNYGLGAALMAASASVMAHPGHEAIGDVLHVEYLFAVGLVVAAMFSAWKVMKGRR